jgi:hypothetical protein
VLYLYRNIGGRIYAAGTRVWDKDSSFVKSWVAQFVGKSDYFFSPTRLQ